MTQNETRQLLKNTALNKIRKICDTSCYRTNNPYYNYYAKDGSYAEQRQYDIELIINDLEKELKQLKNKHV